MNPAACREIDLALGLVDGELSADDHERTDAHLAACPDCRRRAEALWRQDRALSELAAEAVLAAGLAARIGERLRNEAGKTTDRASETRQAAELVPSRRPAGGSAGLRGKAMWALAAGVLVALGVWAIRRPSIENHVHIGPVHPAPPNLRSSAEFARVATVVGRVLLLGDAGEAAVEQGRSVPSGAVLQTVGEESLAVIQLADGTRLELRADTRITLHDDQPAAAVPGKRIVLAEGFLAADVAKQPAGRPLTLSTPQAELVVLGTKFQLSGGGELTYVETTEGSVRVTRKSDGHSVVVDGGFETAVGEGTEPAARPLPAASLSRRLKLDGLFAAALSHDGRTLAGSRYLGGEIQWWDVEAGRMIHAQSAQRRRVHAMAFAPDDATLAAGGVDGLVKVWDRQGAEPLQTFAADGPWISDVARAGDWWAVLSGTEGLEERTLTLRTADGRPVRPPLSFTAQRWAFADDGSRLAAYDKRTKTITVYDLTDGSQNAFPTPVGNNVFSLAFSHDGRRLAVDGSSGMIVLCEAAGGRIVRRIERRGGRIFGMTFSPDDRRLATGHQDGTIRLWNVADGTQSALSAGGPVHARAVAFTPDGRSLMTRETRLATDGAPRDGAVTVWEIP